MFHGSLIRLLRDTFPDHNWPTTAKGAQTTKMELMLFKIVQRLYPSPNGPYFFLQASPIHCFESDSFCLDAVKSLWSSQVRSFDSQRLLEFDVFVKSCNMAIEFQGNYHFFDILTLGEHELFATRDLEKAVTCAFQNVSLLEVPYWWDMDKESLVSTIHSLRIHSDLISSPRTNQSIRHSSTRISK